MAAVTVNPSSSESPSSTQDSYMGDPLFHLFHLHSNSGSTHLDDIIIQVHHEPDDEFLQDVPKVQDDPPIVDVNLRRSTRVHKARSYLKSYHCNQVTSSSSTSPVSNDQEEVNQFKVLLDQKFKLKDLGDLKFFLGLEVARSDKGIALC
uniref:Reverse transcriptase Ty1/copia-type domain-containing protein n=1 Tax=Quercus lobata TaxID=97700 RepID=A0A7N2M507_QUELO